MSVKIKIQSIDKACDECPFYVPTVKGKHVCLFKQLITPVAAMAAMESSDHYDESLWGVDCGGSYSKCSFLPLLYTMEDAERLHDSADTLEDYDPFDENDEDDEPVEEKLPEPEPKKKNSPKTRVFVRKISNPYLAKIDALACPIDAVLEIDDFALIQMSRNTVQRELDAISSKKQIHMGEVYVTSNGHESIAPKMLIHAVVAGQSKLVNELDVRKATARSLEIAEINGVETLGILPFDCGTADIVQVAVAQLGTIKGFLEVNDLTALKNIVVVMSDEESFQVFTEYYNRIFR